ncbi:MAG: hypothetical protein ACOYM0_00855 [Bacteroidales bacterium]
MPGTDKLTVHIFNSAGTFAKSIVIDQIDLTQLRPVDFIQLVYQKKLNVTAPGGSIWKMGRCIHPAGDPNPAPGTPFKEFVFLTDPSNAVQNSNEVTLVEIQLG